MRNQSNKAWTEDELAILKTMYPNTSNIEIAEALRRPKSSIPSIAIRLGLTKPEGFQRAKPGARKIKRVAAEPIEEPKDETFELWKSIQKTRAIARNHSIEMHTYNPVFAHQEPTHQARII